MKKILLIGFLSLLSTAVVAETQNNAAEANTLNKVEMKVEETVFSKDGENTTSETVKEEVTTPIAPAPTETVKEVKPIAGCEKVLTSDDVKEPIARALFTTKVENREPVDKITEVTENMENIVFFTEAKDFKCGVINHTWMKGNDVVYSRDFNITSNRYRFNTSVKAAHYEKDEEAVVVIKDANGTEIKKYLIRIK